MRLVTFFVTPILFVVAALYFFAWEYDDDFMASAKGTAPSLGHLAEVERLVRDFKSAPDAMTSKSCRALYDARVYLEFGPDWRPNPLYGGRRRQWVWLAGSAIPPKAGVGKSVKVAVVLEKQGANWGVRNSAFGAAAREASGWAGDAFDAQTLKTSEAPRLKDLACWRAIR